MVDNLAELDERRFRKVGYSFNRKEAKDHGKGHVIVGTPLRGQRVVTIDNISTAETAMREAIEITKAQEVILLLNRMERMGNEGGGSAIGEIKLRTECLY